MLTPRKFFFFEKWYFDAQCDDGTFVFAYFARFTLFGKGSGQFVVCLSPPDGDAVIRTLPYGGRRVEVSDDGSGAVFGSGEVANGTEGLVRCRQDDVDIELRYSPMDAAWIPGDDGRLLEIGKRALLWQVPIPCARVSGSVTVGERTAAIEGLGYHDFVQTDIPPWKLPLRELIWGRALGSAGAAIWNRPVFAMDGAECPVSRGWMRLGDEEPRLFDPLDRAFTVVEDHDSTGDSFPREMVVGFGQPRVHELNLVDSRMFLGDAVADVAGFGSRLERWLYRTFTGNPVEYKLLSRVAGGPLAEAQAAHERVVWGKGR